MGACLGQKSGHILATSAVAGLTACPNAAVYGSGTWFVRSFMEVLRMVSAMQGGKIRIAAICPSGSPALRPMRATPCPRTGVRVAAACRPLSDVRRHQADAGLLRIPSPQRRPMPGAVPGCMQPFLQARSMRKTCLAARFLPSSQARRRLCCTNPVKGSSA
ncbi:SDR family NAD(P)-dependent oxidoreductase [Paracoccus sp. IB05]|uniref:SDR family NAD(P)-dependent oxidoreductase n=1 Tax=Paracoccus sp. IB05 TaxID=2779367 RepID=UPI0018E7CF65|nr:SDR family NAD(P)-dependent oxidoreductase [Paracoccus sp. IB05]